MTNQEKHIVQYTAKISPYRRLSWTAITLCVVFVIAAVRPLMEFKNLFGYLGMNRLSQDVLAIYETSAVSKFNTSRTEDVPTKDDVSSVLDNSTLSTTVTPPLPQGDDEASYLLDNFTIPTVDMAETKQIPH